MLSTPLRFQVTCYSEGWRDPGTGRQSLAILPTERCRFEGQPLARPQEPGEGKRLRRAFCGSMPQAAPTFPSGARTGR